MIDKHLVVLCTVPADGFGKRLATSLVDSGLAACVNIVAHVTSVYRWQDKTETDPEDLLIIKTTGAAFGPLQQAITEQHPYELPEIIAVPIEAGLPAYLDWISRQTSKAV